MSKLYEVMKEVFYKWNWNILSLCLFLFIWEIGALSLGNGYLFPSVSVVVKTLIGIAGSTALYNNLLATFLRAAECLLLSFLVALPLSYLISRSVIFEKVLSPILYFMKNTPVIAFLFLALIWISAEYVPLFIAFTGMLPVLVINFVAGFRSVDRKYMDLASLYRLTALRKFSYIEYPAIKLYVFAGLSSALGLGWRAIIIGEALASVQNGLGAAMKEAQNYVDVPYLFAITLVSLLTSFFLEKLIFFVSKFNIHKFIRTKHKYNQEQSAESDQALNVSNLSFRRDSSIIFQSFSMYIKCGEVVMLKGKSGIGKSTLINIIGGFENEYTGLIRSGSKSILFQDQRLCPWLSVKDNIDLIIPDVIPLKDQQIMFKALGIDHLMERMPDQISGGEAQRVSLCRALLFPAELYILDEPLTGIGEAQKKELLQWIRTYVKQKQVSVLWISHDEDQVYIADRIEMIQPL